jgi:uncharacterized protein YeaO (DUF488 family)
MACLRRPTTAFAKGGGRTMHANEFSIAPNSIMNTNLRIKRIYEPSDDADGCRVLVDRLWPRGVRRDEAAIDHWMKNIGPSHELRKWFGHRPERWDEFAESYREELTGVEAQELLRELATLAAAGPLTLLYSARDHEHNQAKVIAKALHEIITDIEA